MDAGRGGGLPGSVSERVELKLQPAGWSKGWGAGVTPCREAAWHAHSRHTPTHHKTHALVFIQHLTCAKGRGQEGTGRDLSDSQLEAISCFSGQEAHTPLGPPLSLDTSGVTSSLPSTPAPRGPSLSASFLAPGLCTCYSFCLECSLLLTWGVWGGLCSKSLPRGTAPDSPGEDKASEIGPLGLP